MVKELSGLNTSQIMVTRSAFISTAFNDTNDDLKKYLLLDIDLVFRIYPVIEKKIYQQSCPLW